MDALSIDSDKLNTHVMRAVTNLSAGYSGIMIALGNKLRLYRAMRGRGPMSAPELAVRTGCAERYVREWLASQAAGGYIAFHADSETYELTSEQAMVLADDTSPYFIPNAWEVVASMWFDEDKTADAFRTSKGVSWNDHNERLYCGVAAFFRNGYKANLVGEWLPALDGVADKLTVGANVADVGCGYGHSTILMAQAFPNARFWGFDTHPASIGEARANARAAGVADRVTFEIAGAQDYPSKGFDLICFFDALHDMGDPVGAAAHAARCLARDGTAMFVEPFANDRTEDNLSPIGQLYYAASTTLCCAHAISEGGKMVLGAQAGEARLAKVAKLAGFRRFRRATETPFNLILEARL